MSSSVIVAAFKSHALLMAVSWLFVVFTGVLALFLGAKPADFVPFILFSESYSKYLIFIPLLFLGAYFFAGLPKFFNDARHGRVFDAFRVYVESVDARFVSYIKSPMLWNALAALAVMLPLSLFFCIAKSLIPHLTDYRWDPLFAALDKKVHFGAYPHEILVMLVEKFSLQGAADLCYFLFFVFVLLVKAYCIFMDVNAPRRMQFLWAILLSWIVGGFFLAGVLASVGPIFYQDFYAGASPYQALSDYLFKTSEVYNLHTIPLTRVLLEWVRDESVLDLNAISAMPSMHVGIAALASYYLWNVSKIWGVLGGLFTVLTLLSAVYLGLHYAIDGYAGAALTFLVWRGSKTLAVWRC